MASRMECPRCGSSHIHRTRRSGIKDQVWAKFGQWPYQCLRCGTRFTLKVRFPQWRNASEENNPAAFHSSRRCDSPAGDLAVAFQTAVSKPYAKVLIKAETQDQLDQILLTLDRAISSYRTSEAASRV